MLTLNYSQEKYIDCNAIKMSKYFIPYFFLKYVYCDKGPYDFNILLPDKILNKTLEIWILSTAKIMQLVSRLFESLNKYGFYYLHLVPYYPLNQLVSVFLLRLFKQSICKFSDYLQKKQRAQFLAFLSVHFLRMFGLGERERYCLL